MYIVVRDDIFYIVENISKKTIEELKEIVTSTGRKNLELYFTIYRTIMGLPADITMKQERELLSERYGEPLLDNKKFTSDVLLAQKEFETKKATLPDLIGWLIVERGAKVTPADEVFYVTLPINIISVIDGSK